MNMNSSQKKLLPTTKASRHWEPLPTDVGVVRAYALKPPIALVSTTYRNIVIIVMGSTEGKPVLSQIKSTTSILFYL